MIRKCSQLGDVRQEHLAKRHHCRKVQLLHQQEQELFRCQTIVQRLTRAELYRPAQAQGVLRME